VRDELDVLLDHDRPERLVTSSSTSLRLKGAFSSSSLSASIFEKVEDVVEDPQRFLADE
jgi:hypothetical protein